MTPIAIAAVAGAVTLLLSLALPFAVRPLLVRLGVMDVPNARSSHARPVLRGLGLAVLLALAAGGGLGAALLAHPENALPGATTLVIVVAGSALAGALGLAEDLRGLSVRARSALLIAIALGASLALILSSREGDGSVPVVGGGAAFGWTGAAFTAGLPWWGLALLAVYAVLFISSYINVANFMDGLNGISGFHGVIAGLAFAAAGWLTALPWLLIAGLVLAAGFGGFLPWNLSRRGAFLGDVGSYLLGGAVAVTSFAALVSGVPLLAAIGPMVIPFGDVAVTLVKRVRAGRRWDEPHKEHAYQRIQQLGYSHLQASGLAAGCTLLVSLLGLGSLFTGLIGTIALFLGGLAVLVCYLLLPRLLPERS
ncbi:UDP-phosphate alpha-N-acetyl-D-fucosaminephosphotransferase [Leucobacter allii]|uniref:UDP-phosphate alpha-N-acetyl-D-fucosaminephosphotransferase n=1 Tax=Leucobacter allii TaxID=2932247 RepID=A0ABY4FNT9_9MICO|nr:UDP-phosphate alpha-N-acetyl-D-fucosaminephosphotransferase [Leucobacter allii]UOQ57950.1 UDP-phosphate alpha-N-acetyl-D-fucosaminephosphotransferase [Leucobacter allii]